MQTPRASRNNKRKCKIDPQLFCYVCGKYDSFTKPFDATTKYSYKQWFNKDLKLDKKWCPNQLCERCATSFKIWKTSEDSSTVFHLKTPMIWMNQQNHSDDCYFCLTVLNADCSKIQYPNLKSATKAIPWSKNELLGFKRDEETRSTEEDESSEQVGSSVQVAITEEVNVKPTAVKRPKVTRKSKPVATTVSKDNLQNSKSVPEQPLKRKHSQINSGNLDDESVNCENEHTGDTPVLLSTEKLQSFLDSVGFTSKQVKTFISKLKKQKCLLPGAEKGLKMKH